MLETGWIMKKAALHQFCCSADAPCCGHGQAQQPKKVALSGYLGIIENRELDYSFRKVSRKRAIVLGQNICVEYRYAGGKSNVLPIDGGLFVYGGFAHRTEISSGYTAHIEITYLSAAAAT
jgi:hypothetical protein